MLAGTIMRRVLADESMAKRCIDARLQYLGSAECATKLRLRLDTAHAMSSIHSKYRIVITTSRRNQKMILQVLNRLGVDGYVGSVLCGDDYPDTPANSGGNVALKEFLYGKALEMYGTSRDRCVAVGNLKSDVVAALNVGIRAYAVRGSYRLDNGIARRPSLTAPQGHESPPRIIAVTLRSSYSQVDQLLKQNTC